jgi:hypothetical protein
MPIEAVGMIFGADIATAAGELPLVALPDDATAELEAAEAQALLFP